MGIGLRLSGSASLELLAPGELDRFKHWLAENQAYVFTINGFPHGDFHHTVVKENVHSPDWTTDERKIYTKRLIQVLQQLLPDGMDGGISTSPLSYRHWFETPEARTLAIEQATMNILEVVQELIWVHQKTGKLIHLDLEPEPDGMIESGAEYISWYENHLLRVGIPFIKKVFNIEEKEAESLIKSHLCLCYDVCHFSIGFENHLQILKQLAEKGLKIGKIQISAALRAKFRSPAINAQILESFKQFNEPTYLHQVVARNEDGELKRFPDLDQALEGFDLSKAQEWRAHFHVPVSISAIGQLQSTQEDILRVMTIQKSNPFTTHLEVETYTWEVLPEGLKVPITQSIINELKWVINKAIK